MRSSIFSGERFPRWFFRFQHWLFSSQTHSGGGRSHQGFPLGLAGLPALEAEAGSLCRGLRLLVGSVGPVGGCASTHEWTPDQLAHGSGSGFSSSQTCCCQLQCWSASAWWLSHQEPDWSRFQPQSCQSLSDVVTRLGRIYPHKAGQIQR